MPKYPLFNIRYVEYHAQIQSKPTDKFMNKIIHIEDTSQLEALNKKLSLNLSFCSKLTHHHNYSRSEPYYVGDLIFEKGDTYPPYYAFYSQKTLELVQTIYKEDIEKLGYKLPNEIQNFISQQKTFLLRRIMDIFHATVALKFSNLI